ncbi:MAG: Mrp/NBP35 family ATP-binding protein [Pseudanabaenaceae cyanobacterium bins.68]|nr:Mrp/NBP35 family ATP-binding protein [Pseudanabaenaceae cyanobacterium bins.68]
MAITTADVAQALAHLLLPGTEQSLISGNNIQDLVVREQGVVGFSLVGVTPSQRDQIIPLAKAAVNTLDGVKDVWIKVVDLKPEEAASQSQLGIRHIVAVSSGKGGVGKTTVSVNLAVSLADLGARVGILDADIYGPNVPLMLGMNDFRFGPQQVTKAADGRDLVEPAFNYGVKIVSRIFTQFGNQALAWRGPMLHGIIQQFLSDQINWGNLDYLIVDMPPGTGDAQMSLIQSGPVAGAIIVTTPQAVALLDAQKGVQMFQSLQVPVLGVVENMSYFIPPDLSDRRYDIFGSGGGTKTMASLDLPLLGCVPLEIELREGGDRGVPICLGRPQSASALALRQVATRVMELLP